MRQHIHAVLPCAVTSQKWEKQLDPRGVKPMGRRTPEHIPQIYLSDQRQQTLIATMSVPVSINLATTL